jgi:hypothetical protein
MSSILPTDSTLSSASATAPVNQALIPADVRKAGTKAEQLYSQALDFEQVLMQQLTSELNATTGGVGIARSLYNAMSAEAGIATGEAESPSTSSVQSATSLAPTDPAALDARNGINWIDR